MVRLINTKEAGTQLGVSEKTIYRLVSQGLIPVVKIRDRTLFRPQDLEEFITHHTRRVGRDETGSAQ